MRASRYPLYLLMAILAIDQADRYLLSAVFPLVKEEFHLSDSQLGSLSAAFFIVVTIGAVPFGILVDRYLRTAVVAWGAAIWSSAMIATGLAGSYGALFGSRMFLGTAESTYAPASFSLIADYYPVHERGKVMGLYQVGGVLGFVSLPVGGVIADAWGWRAAFHAYAIPGFILAMLAWRLPEPGRGIVDVEHQQLEQYEAGRESSFARMPSMRVFATVLRIPTVLITLLTQALANFFITGVGVWTTTFLVRYQDMSIAQATAATALLAIGAVAGSIIGGLAGDRLVKRGVSGGRIYVAVAAKLAGVALLMPAFAISNTPIMLTLFGLGAVTLTMPNPPLTAIRADVVHPDLRGRTASMVALVTAGSQALSPLLFGVLSDAIGLRTAFLLLVPWLGVSGVFLWALGPRHLAPDMQRMRQQLAGEELRTTEPIG